MESHAAATAIIKPFATRSGDDGCSPIRHLAMIAGGVGWRSVRLGMFTAYFDASGAGDQLAVVVAGFVSSAELWIEWEAKWLEKLSEYGLDHFHYSELSSWPEPKKAALVAELCKIIRPHVASKSGAAVINQEVNAVFSGSEREEWRINAYAVAGRTVAKKMRQWCQAVGSGRMPELVFEHGDVGRGKLDYLLTSQGYPAPIFKYKKKTTDRKSGIVHEPAIPLQAADLLAYEIFRRIREYRKTGREPNDSRLCADLENIPGEYGCVEYDRLKLQRDSFEQEDPEILIPSVKIKTS